MLGMGIFDNLWWEDAHLPATEVALLAVVALAQNHLSTVSEEWLGSGAHQCPGLPKGHGKSTSTPRGRSDCKKTHNFSSWWWFIYVTIYIYIYVCTHTQTCIYIYLYIYLYIYIFIYIYLYIYIFIYIYIHTHIHTYVYIHIYIYTYTYTYTYIHIHVNVNSVRENCTWIQFPSWDLDYGWGKIWTWVRQLPVKFHQPLQAATGL